MNKEFLQISMCKKRNKIQQVLPLCLCLGATNCDAARPPSSSSPDEILASVPRGPDLGFQEWANFKKLVEMGPPAYDVLGRELLRVKDYGTASGIIAVFAESEGDKNLALRYVKRFLEAQKIHPIDGFFLPGALKLQAKIEADQAAIVKDHPELLDHSPPADADFIAAEEAVLWRQRLVFWLWITGGVMLAALLWHRFLRKART